MGTRHCTRRSSRAGARTLLSYFLLTGPKSMQETTAATRPCTWRTSSKKWRTAEILRQHGGRKVYRSVNEHVQEFVRCLPLSWFVEHRGLAFWLSRRAWACVSCDKLYRNGQAKQRTRYGETHCECGSFLERGRTRRTRDGYVFWRDNEPISSAGRPALRGWTWA